MRNVVRRSARWAVAAGVCLAAVGGCFLSAGARAAGATISTVVENVAVPIFGGSLTIRRIEIAGKGSSGADLLALFDHPSQRTFPDRLGALDAPSIVMPEVVVEIPLGDIKARSVLRDVRLVDVVHGRIGAASVGQVDMSASKGSRAPIRAGIGGMSARDVDLVLLARILLAPRPIGETLGTAVRYATLKDIEMNVPRELRVHLDRVSLARLGARALAVPLVDLPARFQAMGRDSQPLAERQKAAVLIGQDMLESFALGGFEIRGLQVELPREGTTQTVERIAVADLAQPRIGDVAVEGVRFFSADAEIRIGIADVRGLDFRPLLEWFLGLARRNGLDERGMDVRSWIIGFDRLLVADVSATRRLPPDATQDPRAGPSAPLLRLARMDLVTGNVTNAIPGSLYGSLEGLSVGTERAPRYSPLGTLAQMGYSALTVASGRFDLTWNQAKSEIVLDKLSADMPDMGSFEIAATAIGAGPDLFSSEPAVQQAAALWLRLKLVDATVRNAGFFEKLIDFSAKDRGRTPEAVRDELYRLATVELPENLGGGRTARQIGAALGQFVKQPRSLHVGIGSSTGFGFAELPLLRNPPDLLDRLDVSVTANQ